MKRSRRVAKIHHTKARARYSQIKPYVKFKFSDDDYTARKIKVYYDELWPLIHQPHTVYKSKSVKNLGVASVTLGNKRRTQLKAIPVPSGGVADLNVRVKGGRLVVGSHHVVQKFFTFDKRKLARNGTRHVTDTIVGTPANALFKIQTGNYEINAAHSKATVAREVANLQAKYQLGAEIVSPSTGEIRKVKRGQQWQLWLNGLVMISAKNQKTAKQYIADQAKAKKASYKTHKKKRIK